MRRYGRYAGLNFIFSIFCCVECDGVQGIISQILGGIPVQTGEIEIVLMGKWLFLIAFYLLLTGIELNSRESIRLYALYRYKSYHNWWRKNFYSIQLLMSMLLMESVLLWSGYERINGLSSGSAVQIVFLFWVHMCFLVMLQCLLHLFIQNGMGASILIFLEGIGYLFSLKIKNCGLLTPGIWGMYIRSSLAEKNGFQTILVVFIQLAAIAVCAIFGDYIERKIRDEGGGFHEK